MDKISCIEAGFHCYNSLEKEFNDKEYPSDKRAAICYAMGVEAGKCIIKEKMVKVFKPDRSGVWP